MFNAQTWEQYWLTLTKKACFWKYWTVPIINVKFFRLQLHWLNCRIDCWNKRREKKKRRADEREQIDLVSVFWITAVWINWKNYISFIIWVTTLSYNEMLINWPLFISLISCRFTRGFCLSFSLIFFPPFLGLTHWHVAESLLVLHHCTFHASSSEQKGF